jgi:hypothetical protein
MRVSSSYAIIAVLAGGATAIAACGGNSSTGPSPSTLAHTFDSAATVDSGTNRGQVEALLALAADEGVRPTGVTVTTDAGNKSFQVIALEVVDTSTTGSGLVTDSASLFLGYTTDHTTYLATESQVLTGNPDLIPPARVHVSAPVLAGLHAMMRSSPVGRSIATRAGGGVNLFAVVVQGHSSVTADTVTITSSASPVSGSCAWQHQPVPAQLHTNVDSTTACTLVAVTQSFSLHFPATGGIDPAFQHVTMASTTVRGPRIVPPR